MNIGILGCGAISPAYFEGARHASNLTIKACADLRLESARERAETYGCEAVEVAALLADPEIELIVNLTIPRVHVATGLEILRAGKHLYAEKPLATSAAEGRLLLDEAGTLGLRIGSAPDTFLFRGAQTARKLVDDGWIGRPLCATAFMMVPGHEHWHPNPGFYYEAGGGPLFDMGPYYLTALVDLLGPVTSVMARTTRARDERLATSEGASGRILPVSVDTHCAGLLEFANGVVATMIMSFDVQAHHLSPLTLHGTEGSLEAGDPNVFAECPRLYRPEDGAWREIPLTHADNKRMFGVVDMVDAIRAGRPHRASGELAFHVLEVMEAFGCSVEAGAAVAIESTVARPAALPVGLRPWQAS